jgi:hypothetical protein
MMDRVMEDESELCDVGEVLSTLLKILVRTKYMHGKCGGSNLEVKMNSITYQIFEVGPNSVSDENIDSIARAATAST